MDSDNYANRRANCRSMRVVYIYERFDGTMLRNYEINKLL